MKKTITDNEILFDLEFRGVDNFISEMQEGFFVPLCFVSRIKKIISKHYGITLKENNRTIEKVKGCFCSMNFNDFKIELKGEFELKGELL
jgi:hypothetical protein